MITCPVCENIVRPYAYYDSNKSCNNGLPPSGHNVLYVKCTQCKFVCCPEMYSWDVEKFKHKIYNDDYIKVDPEYTGERSKRMAEWFATKYAKRDSNILDYGAGNGSFALSLHDMGYNHLVSWDPMWGVEPSMFWAGRFDVITAFEVFEHTPTPLATLKQMKEWLSPGGIIIISTLVNDTHPADFWYIAPRNGHISCHSKSSLESLFSRAGMSVYHQCESIHIGLQR